VNGMKLSLLLYEHTQPSFIAGFFPTMEASANGTDGRPPALMPGPSRPEVERARQLWSLARPGPIRRKDLP
jgi:hypothetical protein